jgi:hypothetical protein
MRPSWSDQNKRHMKTCRRCGKAKPEAEFPFSKREGKPIGACYDCLNAARREKRASRPPAPPKPHRFAWAPNEIEQLRHMIETGHTSYEIAAALKYSLGAVRNQRIKHGFPSFHVCRKRPIAWTPKQLERLQGLRARWLSYAECAAKLGTSRGAIARGVACLKEKAQHP